MSGPYDAMINLPRHVSAKHPQMPLADRAAQFSPFAALAGFDAAIMETGRLTEERIELDEYEKAVLNDALCSLQARLPAQPVAAVTYFKPDEKKSGGAYVTAEGAVSKIDAHARAVVMADGSRIPIDDIVAITETGAQEQE